LSLGGAVLASFFCLGEYFFAGISYPFLNKSASAFFTVALPLA
jgi:hypothetical protein